MANPIQIRGVRKTFGHFVALEDVDLDIHAGEFVTLLGPSGSGKTTLLMILAGFARPDRGSIKVSGSEIVRTAPHKRDVGMVFQNYALFPHMSVRENVAYPLKLRRYPAAERDRRVRDALALVHLEEFMDRGVQQLSGGQRQRVALARAIVFEPKILLMDEPLSALDKKLREQMQIELKHLHERLGMTTVYVTHDQREALTMSNRVAVMSDGVVRQYAEPQDVYERPADRFVADFVGESSFVPIEPDGQGFTLQGRPIHGTAAPTGASRHWLVLRPEKLELLGSDGQDARNVIEGKVLETVYQGETLLVHVQMNDAEESVAVRLGTSFGSTSTIPHQGESIRLGLHPRDTIVVGD